MIGDIVRWAVLAASMGVAGLWLPACADASKDMAQDVLIRTLPPGEPTPSLSEPVRLPESIQFTWDFETRLDAAAYANWLKTQLPDFQLLERDGANLRLSKQVGGDGCRVHITLQPGDGVTRVHVQLTMSPD